MEPEFYVPENVRTQVGKPGAYSFEPVDDATSNHGARGDRVDRPGGLSKRTSGCSNRGVAKEVARTVLPLSMYTKYYWSCNPRSLMHFFAPAEARVGTVRDPSVRPRRRSSFSSG